MAVKKNTPLVLPLYNWAGEPADFRGKPTTWAEAANYPVAYLSTQQLLDSDFLMEIFYVGAQVNQQGFPIRVPNIMMCSLELAEEILAQSDLVERLDRLGVILCKPTQRPNFPGPLESLQFRSGLEGMPISPDTEKGEDYFLLKDPETYIGGRILIIHDSFRMSDYWGGDFVEEHDYTAEPGSSAACAAAPGGFNQAGTSSLPATTPPDLPISVSLENLEYLQDNIDADLLALEQLAGRFDRIKKVIEVYHQEASEYPIPINVTCSDGVSNTLYNSGTLFITGSNDPSISQSNDATDAVLAQFEGEYVQLHDGAVTVDEVDALLDFFED